MAPMAFKHFTPNFERARTFTFVHVHILDVRERAPPATPTFGCARRNSKRLTLGSIEPTSSSEFVQQSVLLEDVTDGHPHLFGGSSMLHLLKVTVGEC